MCDGSTQTILHDQSFNIVFNKDIALQQTVDMTLYIETRPSQIYALNTIFFFKIETNLTECSAMNYLSTNLYQNRICFDD